ncbi:placental prolactin-related protein 4-like [Muntiacus reevesi]|uniref:placental prolactin-related protein 4-like n=1 Tax=Muntiacus reevesi TaxID=9886 RepID=UPI003306F9AE
MASWLSLRSIRCSRFPPPHPIWLIPHGQQESSPWDHSAIPMAPAPSFRGHQWTYNPVRGSHLLLLLVMSNVLLCQGNFCTSLCPSGNDLCLNSLKDLFTHATNLSHDIYNLSSKMFNEFLSTDEQYAQGRKYCITTTNSCLTTSLHAPEEKEQVQHMHMSLIRWILMLLYSWGKPLYELVKDLQSMKEVSDAILSSARENVKKVQELQALIDRPSSQMGNEDMRHSSFYNLFQCLHRDSCKTDIYTKLLVCQLLYDKC